MPVAPGAKTGDNEAHEHVELEGRALRLVHELDHHAYPTIAAWVEKHNRYAVWEAEMYERFLREPIPASIGPGKRFKRRLKKVYLRLPMRPLVRFLYAYVVRLGFLDGRPGLVFCTLLAFYDFLAWANVYEARPEGSGVRDEPGKRRGPARRPAAAGIGRRDPGSAEPSPEARVRRVGDLAIEAGEPLGLAVGVVVAADRPAARLARGDRARSGSARRSRIARARAAASPGGTRRPVDAVARPASGAPRRRRRSRGRRRPSPGRGAGPTVGTSEGWQKTSRTFQNGRPTADSLGERDPVGDPEPVGPAAEVDLVLPLAGDHELGVDPGVEHLPGGVQEGREPRAGDQRARPCRSTGTRPGPPGRPGRPSGSAIPRGITADRSAGDAEVATQVVGQLAAGRDQPAAPRRLSRSRPSRRGNSSTVWT